MSNIHTMAESVAESTPSVSDRGMLIDLNISQWAGMKKDKRASEKVTSDHHAKRGSARVTKSLLHDCQDLQAIQQLVGQARNHVHYVYTQNWSDNGQRFCSTKAYFHYWPIITQMRDDFYRLVETFLSNYSWEITKAQAELGDLFDEDDYPSVEELRNKFRFEIVRSPVPDSGHWMLDIAKEDLDEMREECESYTSKRIAEAMNDVWSRLHKAMTTISERLDYGDDEQKKIFKASTVDNLHELVDLLDVLNVTDDPTMVQMKDDLARAMRGVTPEALREDAALRAATKKSVDEAIKNLPSLM